MARYNMFLFQRIKLNITFFISTFVIGLSHVSRSTEAVRILSICVNIAYIFIQFCFVALTFFELSMSFFVFFHFSCIMYLCTKGMYKVQTLEQCTNYINSKNNTSCLIITDNITIRSSFQNAFNTFVIIILYIVVFVI